MTTLYNVWKPANESLGNPTLVMIAPLETIVSFYTLHTDAVERIKKEATIGVCILHFPNKSQIIVTRSVVQYTGTLISIQE